MSDSWPRRLVRLIFAGLYLLAGVLHVIHPHPFLTITPGWVPFPEAVILLTGIAEIAGAIGLAQPFGPGLRRAAGIGLALYAVCVFPANINHFAMDMQRADHGLGLGYHLPRMVLQPILVWLALWTGRVTDWPFRRHGRDPN
jgi:uncharacterized membrane protein